MPLFNDLVEDSDYLIRAACAQALPTMCSLVEKNYSKELFSTAFQKLMNDPNPFVL